MAYSTGSASGAHDLLDKFRSFLLANSWTVNKYEAVGSGFRLHVNKGAVYLNFRSYQAENISAANSIMNTAISVSCYGFGGYISQGYNGSLAWNAQAGAPINPSGGQIQGGFAVQIETTCNYHFFAYPDSDEVYLVVEFLPTKYQLFSAGTIRKYTSGAVGGEWVSFPTRSPLSNYNLPHSFGMGHYGSGSMVPFRACEFSYAIEAVSTYIRANVDGIDGWAYESYTTPIPSLLTAVSQNVWSFDYPDESLSPLMWNPPLTPCVVMIQRTGQAEYSPFGEIRNFRRLIITQYQPGEEFSLGSDTWKVFPLFQKGGYSSSHGFALKKVS